MPPKERKNRYKIRCLECNVEMDFDYKNKHNLKFHQVLLRQRKSIYYNVVGAPKNPHAPLLKVRKHFLTRYTVKNGISNLYILLKSALKMQKMPFQRPKFQKISGGECPQTPYNCVITMASPH